jgi:hypothetical protein
LTAQSPPAADDAAGATPFRAPMDCFTAALGAFERRTPEAAAPAASSV